MPDNYLGVQIRVDGRFIKNFNGAGRIASEAEKSRSTPMPNLHSISVSALMKFQAKVHPEDRIPLRLIRAVRTAFSLSQRRVRA